MIEPKQRLRDQILDAVAQYHSAAFAPAEFLPGESPVPVSGKVFGPEELQFLVDSALDFWLTAGRFAEKFERKLANFVGVRDARLVNSGSSANLIAMSTLTSPSLGDRRLKPGDEVITVAAGFPTTVNPILQNQLIPVFVDISLPNYDIDVTQLEAALSERTRAIFLAHTLGNPFDLDAVTAFARNHQLWLIEDCCDALGSTYNGKMVGTFGDVSTVSFYPAHHITTGEGGAVMTQRPALTKIIESFRDWGRDCWCAPGCDNTCGKRFDWQLGTLPAGYDHKYTYSHIGYNLKLTDMQAAVGLAQIDKLPAFIAKRKHNFHLLSESLKDLQDFFILPQPTPKSDPSWFGYPIGIRPESGATRNAVIRELENRKIGTRLLFGGNLTRQPAYKEAIFRAIGDLKVTDFVMENVFWVGLYPGLSGEMIEYLADSLRAAAIKGKTARIGR